MSAEEFARLLHGRRVGKGKWTAKCPAHPDRHPSLSIAVGKRVPLVFKCMSNGCDSSAILGAMGLKWSDILTDRLTPDAWKRVKDENRLEYLRRRHGLVIMAQAVENDRRRYWAAAERRIVEEIWELKNRLYPQQAEARIKREKFDERVSKVGWERMWEDWWRTQNDGI